MKNKEHIVPGVNGGKKTWMYIQKINDISVNDLAIQCKISNLVNNIFFYIETRTHLK